MSINSIKAMFALLVTGLGWALLSIGIQEAHGAGCPAQDCETCVFCGLATPACLSSCQGGCKSSAAAQTDETQKAEPSVQDDEDILENPGSSDFDLENRELVCPVAVDLIEGTKAKPKAP